MAWQLSGERLILREMSREELPAVLEVYNSNPGYNLLRNGTDRFSLTELAAEYDSTLSIPRGHWLTLVHGDAIIGVMHLIDGTPAEPKTWINLLLIHANHQRKGWGREAVSLVEKHCQDTGSRQIHHGVIAKSEPALLFWGRLGYEQYRQVSGPVGRLVQPVLLVAKWLQAT